MTNKLTPAQAAKRVSVSRSTISRALQNKELFGIRGNNNRWLIDPDELEKWAESTDQTSFSDHKEGLKEQLSRMAIDLATMTTKVELLEAQLTDAKADRDAWKALATRPWWHFFK